MNKDPTENLKNLARTIAGYEPFEKRVSLIQELLEKVITNDNQILKDLKYVV